MAHIMSFQTENNHATYIMNQTHNKEEYSVALEKARDVSSMIPNDGQSHPTSVTQRATIKVKFQGIKRPRSLLNP